MHFLQRRLSWWKHVSCSPVKSHSRAFFPQSPTPWLILLPHRQPGCFFTLVFPTHTAQQQYLSSSNFVAACDQVALWPKLNSLFGKTRRRTTDGEGAKFSEMHQLVWRFHTNSITNLLSLWKPWITRSKKSKKIVPIRQKWI